MYENRVLAYQFPPRVLFLKSNCVSADSKKRHIRIDILTAYLTLTFIFPIMKNFSMLGYSKRVSLSSGKKHITLLLSVVKKASGTFYRDYMSLIQYLAKWMFRIGNI